MPPCSVGDRPGSQGSAAAEPQGTPALGLDAELTVQGTCPLLREVRVQLDLVDGGHHAGRVDDVLKVVGVEVRHTDRTDFAVSSGVN